MAKALDFNFHRRLIFALDVTTYSALVRYMQLAHESGVKTVKLGATLMASRLRDPAFEMTARYGFDVMIDLKFHDIPFQVGGAVEMLTRDFAPQIMTVHCSGGGKMLVQAVEGARRGIEYRDPDKQVMPLLAGITALTSLTDDDLNRMGFRGDCAGFTLNLAGIAWEAGIPALVCSTKEIALLRRVLGYDLKLIVPGISLAGKERDDQNRTGEPGSAIRAGADYLVVGRDIRRADDPACVVNEYFTRMSAAFQWRADHGKL